MKNLFFILYSIGIVHASQAQKVHSYPLAEKDSLFCLYFGDTLADPYQWMEDPDDPRLEIWLNQQKKLTQKQQKQQTKVWALRDQLVSMYHDKKNETLSTYKDEEKSAESKYVFKSKHTNYKRWPDLLYKRRAFVNYETLFRTKDFMYDKHDHILVRQRMVNEEEDIAAFLISHQGSDWVEVHFFDLNSGKHLQDTLKYLQSSSKMVWDGRGVYYDRYDPPKEGKEFLNVATGQALYYHKIGTPQEEDTPLYQNPNTTGTNRFYFFQLGDRTLFLSHFYTVRDKMYRAWSYAPMQKDESFLLNNFLIYPKDEHFTIDLVKTFGDTVILTTDWNAPNGKVLMMDINQPNQVNELVPEYDMNLRGVDQLGDDKIICSYRKDNLFSALIFNLRGELIKKIDAPEGKKLNALGEASQDSRFTEFCISSFYHPDLWYQMSLENYDIKPVQSVTVPYDADDLETRYVKYRSKDGTEVPMFITCLKDTKLNGKNPTLIYGYGGYGHTIDPFYDPQLTLMMLHGGILAIPNIRGGGAEGEDWGESGRRLKKQNAIDDFIAAAQYLVDQNYTSPDQIVIKGKSHGGLLVAAAATQRPELFKAVIAEAGPYDMLRFDQFTAGSVSTNLLEFGSTSDKKDYQNLRSYSPLHKVKAGTRYPDFLLITGDSDDRVPPLHTYKFLASLQQNGDPIGLYQMYVVPGSGHGGALSNKDWEAKTLFEYYFLFDQVGLRFY